MTKSKISTEDYGGLLIHLGESARGAFTASQVAAGNKNRFAFEIYGTKSGVMWNQERPDELWIGNRNEPNRILIKDPSMLLGPAGRFRRPPWRAQRRLRRCSQTALQAVLPACRRSVGPHRLPHLRRWLARNGPAGKGR